MPDRTDLLVVGAGPYAYSAAAFARDNGIDTRIVGHPMAFWREHMPADMFLRSGPDWHLDGRGEHTFEAFFEDRGLRPEEFDPIPIAVFLDYTEWFRARKSLDVDERLVTDLTKPDGAFVATMEDGSTITADKVLAAPGIRHFVNLPAWYADVPPARRVAHLRAGRRSTSSPVPGSSIIGGRQSAYEWAALLCDHGAEHVDVVHRHTVPDVRQGQLGLRRPRTSTRRWPSGAGGEGCRPSSSRPIAAEFWQVGRLTLEPWLVPRMRPGRRDQSPGRARWSTSAAGDRDVTLTLSDGTALTADHVVFASGYRADLARVPYLGGVLDRVSVTDGFPDLTEGFETSLAGLYVTGFASTRDFGPFYGFTKGCPSAARIAVAEMMS